MTAIEGHSQLASKISGKVKEQELDWKMPLTVCTVVPLDCVAFPPQGGYILVLTFKRQRHVLPPLHCSVPFRCWIFKVLSETGKFFVLWQFACNFSFTTSVGFYWSSTICSFSCSSFPKVIFLAKSYIRAFLTAPVFKWGTGFAYCIWF